MVALETSIIVDTHQTYQKQSAMDEWTGTESFSIIAKIPFSKFPLGGGVALYFLPCTPEGY